MSRSRIAVVVVAVLIGGLAGWMATHAVEHYRTLGYQLPRSGLVSILAAAGLVIVCCAVFAVASSAWLRVGVVALAVPALVLAVFGGTQPPVVSCHAGGAIFNSRAWWGASQESGGGFEPHGRRHILRAYAAGYNAKFSYTCRGDHLVVFRQVG